MPRAERRSAITEASLARAESRAREARQRGLQEGNAGRPAVGARYVRAGLRQLGWLESDLRPDMQQVHEAHHALAARMLGILAEWEADLGRIQHGLRLLDRAEGLAAAEDRGILLLQRGLIFVLAGRGDDAVRSLGESIALLDGNAAETENLAAALINRSFCYLNTGQVRRARADLVWCQRVAAEGGHDPVAAKALHNLGYCDVLAGDIPAALQLFSEAASLYQRFVPSYLPVLAMDRARALLAAGLAEDAGSELDNAIASFREQRLDHDLGEAELTRAQAALAAGDLGAARQWAAAAERRFRRRGNAAWTHLAGLTRLRARAASSARPSPIAAEALRLALRLRACGLAHDADRAELLAARALLAAGLARQAEQRIATVRRRGSAAPLDVCLMRRLAQAELAQAEGRPGGALAELRAGLALVQARRNRLGSLDLRTGAAALGADLAAAGLGLVLDRGSAPLVFAWLERTRAQAFRARPVRPPADPRAAAILAELRQLSYLIRGAELNGARDPAAISRRAELQREIREYSWQTSGLGEATAQASLGEVSASLEQSGQCLVGILARHGGMLAVIVRRGFAHLTELGDFEMAAEAARRLNADLDTLAGRRLPSRLETVLRESIRQQTEVLTAEILTPLLPLLGDEHVVLVPAGSLASIPWGMLPDLRGRPVTVSPSASSWLAAWRQERTQVTDSQELAPLLVAGPDLQHAAAEVSEIAKVYPGSRPLLAETATVSATLRGLDGAELAHLAAHGYHDRENVLFSRLDLSDGPLMAYDIQQLATAPRQVILSACDVGRTVVRPGEEILGFTAALLYIGTATVISSVTRVADDAAVGTMASYHRALRSGARPAEALARAVLTEPFSPFICFGSG